MLFEKKKKASQIFKFKQFDIRQENCAMKIGTDGVLLGAWAAVSSSTTKVLDVGTGTGVIAIMLAQRTENAEIVGVEIDELVCQEANDNMQAAPWSDRLRSVLAPIQDFKKTTTERFDLIVSNPPFFTGGTLSINQDRTNVRHTVKLPTGELLQAARELLTPEGRFCVILPLIEGLRFKEQAAQYNLYCSKMTEVKAKAEKSVERLLLQFEPTEKTLEKDSLVIQKGGRHEYTDEYIALTKDFYLKM
ncbi:MAG: tRNA1(Val) (adenine(37)-N6)-methyltransferase [Saprospiraceae bacterium]